MCLPRYTKRGCPSAKSSRRATSVAGRGTRTAAGAPSSAGTDRPTGMRARTRRTHRPQGPRSHPQLPTRPKFSLSLICAFNKHNISFESSASVSGILGEIELCVRVCHRNGFSRDFLVSILFVSCDSGLRHSQWGFIYVWHEHSQDPVPQTSQVRARPQQQK